MALREWNGRVPGGEVVVTLQKDGSVAIEGPAGPVEYEARRARRPKRV